MPEHSPIATKLAEDLGLTTDEFVPVDEARGKALKEELSGLYTRYDEHTVEVIMSSFSARCLPQLVNAYRGTKKIDIYTCVLRFIVQFGYFAKYMRTHPDAKTLLKDHAQFLLNADPLKWIKVYDDAETLTALFKFLLAYGAHYPEHVEPIPEDTRKELNDVFGAAAHYYVNETQKTPKEDQLQYRKNSTLFQSAWDAQRALEGTMTPSEGLGAIGKMMPYVTCATEQCWAKGKQESLAACSRCKTQAYCSAKHQSLDWKRHKKLCFETSW